MNSASAVHANRQEQKSLLACEPADYIRANLPCTVRIARSDADYERALEVRRRGYSKIVPPGTDMHDPYDRLPNCFILLAEDLDGKPVGTARLLHRPAGPVETARYIDLPSHPGLNDCLEGSKFSIPTFPGSTLAKMAMWKAGYLLALALQSKALMVNVRPSARRNYEALLFEDTGVSFIHPLDAQRRTHTVMALDLETARARYKAHRHKWYDFFFVQKHPQIRLFD